MDYIKTGIFDKKLSNVIKSAFSLRTESDYEDFYVISHEEARQQVLEAGLFLETVSRYIEEQISDSDRE